MAANQLVEVTSFALPWVVTVFERAAAAYRWRAASMGTRMRGVDSLHTKGSGVQWRAIHWLEPTKGAVAPWSL
jgi:hypothetical protein